MALGCSLGDAIAVAGVIERIVAEVRSYRSAPQHFQRLAIELGFLSQVCTQILHVTPTVPSEIAQLQRIRAIAIQCLGPLQNFESKMRRYDSVIGPEAWKGGPVSGAQERLSNFRKKLHWSAIERREVDELRAILASEILAINTLLSIQDWYFYIAPEPLC